MAAGYFIHLALDCIFIGSYSPQFYCFTCPHLLSVDALPAIDAIILLTWLAHEEIEHKIKDYI